MSANEPDHLEFRGKDLKECEQFIAAVNKYARAEGKLWEDQWIADFVATCVAGDALLWWSALDEETQRSWRRLRSAMLLRYRLRFAGKTGAEAEDFVDWVRQRALDLGKLNDVQWAAEFASGCFVGSALRWYMSLDRRVRGDWDTLQQAIFVQYGQEMEEGSCIIPTAAPAATSLVTAASAPVVNNGRRRGRIRVFTEGDSETYYLSKVLGINPNLHGRLYATKSVADALEVEYESLRASDGPQNLLIPDNQIKGFDMLGMKWYREDRTLSYNILAICGVNSTSGAASLDNPYIGPTLTTAWKVSQSDDHQISISVLDASRSGKRLVFLSNDPVGYRQLWFKLENNFGESNSKLIFEPI
ncbi:hypothetical protein FRC04_009118 [Tulasnella sp. 424]|nr:hypothetical protein FRC04_009118 [Tulasnella sp. 424]